MDLYEVISMNLSKKVLLILVIAEAILMTWATYYYFSGSKKPKVAEIIPINNVIAEKNLVIYMSNISKYYRNYTIVCRGCKINLTISGYFIFFKKPLLFTKNGSRLVLANVTIVYSKWPLEKRISDSVALGFLANEPITAIPVIAGGKTSYIIAYMAYTWIGLADGFNDIQPTSKIFTFNLDSSILRTGGGSRGKYPERVKAIALVIIPPYPPEKIKYIDLRHAYIAYVKG